MSSEVAVTQLKVHQLQREREMGNVPCVTRSKTGVH